MTLDDVGLRAGEQVRFRRGTGQWRVGVAVGREKDGSLAIRETGGAARAIPLDRVEVRCTGPRGGRGWERLLERACRVEQRSLF